MEELRSSAITLFQSARSHQHAHLLVFVLSSETAISPESENFLPAIIPQLTVSSIKALGKGSSKALLEFDDEEGVRRRRQFALEEATKWHMVPEFGGNGPRALLQAWSNMEKSRKEWTGKDVWDHHVSQQERLGRGTWSKRWLIGGKSYRDPDKRHCNPGQLSDGHLGGFDFTYEEAEMRSSRWSPLRRKGSKGSVAQDVARSEARMESIQNGEESENEVKRRKNARNGKKPRLEGHLTLGDLGEELGEGLDEPMAPRKFEESMRMHYRLPLIIATTWSRIRKKKTIPVPIARTLQIPEGCGEEHEDQGLRGVCTSVR
ncbi:hypothetical protein L211DRAFT_884376 [Terfezia boudieri ATCC MYA-4762]|uniref:Uncharacterized protein n=1 Tax=Terfezia boudieri ATCC MYA-4762 TaxID=1051890 RepID=A0A3N4LX44_9PEZI|nr:hypothetical protein L211DRAFT_884376 [Terfezia boudieri ATCC MYA-4762]